MRTGILKSLALGAVTAGALIAAMPQAEAARVVVGINTGYPQPVQPCNGYTRTFVDGYGYQRTAQGTACMQPNGEWVVVSETLMPIQNFSYGPVIYRDVPSYYVRPSVVYYNDRNMHWSHRDNHYDHNDHGRRHH